MALRDRFRACCSLPIPALRSKGCEPWPPWPTRLVKRHAESDRPPRSTSDIYKQKHPTTSLSPSPPFLLKPARPFPETPPSSIALPKAAQRHGACGSLTLKASRCTAPACTASFRNTTKTVSTHLTARSAFAKFEAARTSLSSTFSLWGRLRWAPASSKSFLWRIGSNQVVRTSLNF